MNKINEPLSSYNLNTINYENINTNNIINETKLKYYWWINPFLIEKLVSYCNNKINKENKKILDVGSNINSFELSTHIIDCTQVILPDKCVIKMDIDYDLIPNINDFFDFIYCRHTMEDIQNPHHIFKEMCRVSKKGYIETPSPLAELTKGVDNGLNNYCGYKHHRYIVWSSIETNTIHFLPKYPIIEHLVYNDELTQKNIHILNNYPLYWNNYYIWDENNPPNIIMYRNGIDFLFTKSEYITVTYTDLLQIGINESIKYTNHFLEILEK